MKELAACLGDRASYLAIKVSISCDSPPAKCISLTCVLLSLKPSHVIGSGERWWHKAEAVWLARAFHACRRPAVVALPPARALTVPSLASFTLFCSTSLPAFRDNRKFLESLFHSTSASFSLLSNQPNSFLNAGCSVPAESVHTRKNWFAALACYVASQVHEGPSTAAILPSDRATNWTQISQPPTCTPWH